MKIKTHPSFRKVAPSVLDWKGTLLSFPLERRVVSAAYYYHMKNKRPNQSIRDIILLCDNARPRTDSRKIEPIALGYT